MRVQYSRSSAFNFSLPDKKKKGKGKRKSLLTTTPAALWLTCAGPAFPYLEQQDDDGSQMRNVSGKSKDVHGCWVK